jgi:hypothetical protein
MVCGLVVTWHCDRFTDLKGKTNTGRGP